MKKFIRILAMGAVIPLTSSALSVAASGAKPLRVYILAGQSNMEGHAKVETFDYLGDDPATVHLLEGMRRPDGKPRVCRRVWISYLTGSPDRGALGEGAGKLTAGYGARCDPKKDGGKIGPEFTFGLAMSGPSKPRPTGTRPWRPSKTSTARSGRWAISCGPNTRITPTRTDP